MKIHRLVLVIICSVVIGTSLFGKTAFAATNSYIVELRSAPLSKIFSDAQADLSQSINANTVISPTDSKLLKARLSVARKAIQIEQDAFIKSLPSNIQIENSAPKSADDKSVQFVNSSSGIKHLSNAINAIVLVMTTEEAADISKMSGVKKVEPSRVFHTSLMDSVPMIKAPNVWSGSYGVTGLVSSTGANVRIAIIDTGVDYFHPDLGGCFVSKIVNGKSVPCKVVGGTNFVGGGSDPMDDNGHGTHVADIAAGSGMPMGVAPGASILAYKVCDSEGNCDTSNIIAGIDAALDPNNDGNLSDHADVANLSLGGSGNPDDIISEAVDNATNAGILMVVAAGNDGPSPESISSPGAARKALTVGAVDKSGNLAGFSSRGPVVWMNSGGQTMYEIKPDVVAPGVSICAARWAEAFPQGNTDCYKDNLHVAISGTSMATPHVTGLAALLKSLHHDWTPQILKEAIEAGASKSVGCTLSSLCTDNHSFDWGYGFINAETSASTRLLPIALIEPLGIVSGPISIMGTAGGRNFLSYTISVGKGIDPDHFDLIYSSKQPVSNAPLINSLDTHTLSEGFNVVRLTVIGFNKSVSHADALVYVNNMAITSVGEHANYISGGVQNIYGSISFRGQFSFVITADSPKGIRVCSGDAVISNQIICTADLSFLSEGLHKLYLSVTWKGVISTDEPFNLGVIRGLVDGWPLELDGYSGKNSLVVPSAGIGSEKNLLVPYYESCTLGQCFGDSTMRTYDGAGEMIAEIKKLSDGSKLVDDWLSAFYHDSTRGQNEVLSIGKSSEIYNLNGDMYARWSDANNYSATSPATIYERADGKQFAFYFTDRFGMKKLVARDTSGAVVSGFPIDMGLSNYHGQVMPTQVEVIGEKDRTVHAVSFSLSGSQDMSSGGLNNLKLKANIVSNIFGTSGSVASKQAIMFDGSGRTLSVSMPYSVLVDINGDSVPEVISAYTIIDAVKTAANPNDSGAYETYVTIMDSDGNIMHTSQPIYGYKVAQFVPVNVGAGRLLFVLALNPAAGQSGGVVIALNAMLRTAWTLDGLGDGTKYSTFEAASVADVNADRSPEVIISYNSSLGDGPDSGVQIINSSGQLIRNIRLPALGKSELFNESPIIISDFGQKGRMSMVLQTMSMPENNFVQTPIGKTHIFVIDISGKNACLSLCDAAIQWKTILGDDAHTSGLNFALQHIAPPVIRSVTPSVAHFGDKVSIIGEGFATAGNVLTFVSNDQSRHLEMTVDGYSGGTAMRFLAKIPAGTYLLTVRNPITGESNAIPFTVISQTDSAPAPIPVVPAKHGMSELPDHDTLQK